jgi:hypothetical protein
VGGEELVCTAMATEDDDVVQESENEGEEAYEGEEMQGNDEINNAGGPNVSLVIWPTSASDFWRNVQSA